MISSDVEASMDFINFFLSPSLSLSLSIFLSLSLYLSLLSLSLSIYIYIYSPLCMRVHVDIHLSIVPEKVNQVFYMFVTIFKTGPLGNMYFF